MTNLSSFFLECTSVLNFCVSMGPDRVHFVSQTVAESVYLVTHHFCSTRSIWSHDSRLSGHHSFSSARNLGTSESELEYNDKRNLGNTANQHDLQLFYYLCNLYFTSLKLSDRRDMLLITQCRFRIFFILMLNAF